MGLEEYLTHDKGGVSHERGSPAGGQEAARRGTPAPSTEHVLAPSTTFTVQGYFACETVTP